MNNIIFCNCLKEVNKSFYSANKQKLIKMNNEIDKNRMFFYHNNDHDYAQNLNDICNKIFSVSP